MVSERKKRNPYAKSYSNPYFWRTHEQQETDLIEEQDGQLKAFEFKWNAKAKNKLPETFSDSYGNVASTTVTPDNFWDFVK